MTRSFSRLIKPILLGIAVLTFLACGASTTVSGSGGTGIAAAPTATATPPPTATPTPAHLLVTVHPVSCSGSQPCTPYVCHDGTTCHEQGICTASSWPTFTLSNIGQVALTWHATMNGSSTPPTGWTMSVMNGTLAGGETSASITVNDDPSNAQGIPTIVFAGGAQRATITLDCGIG